MEIIIKLKISPNSSKNEIIKSETDVKIKLTAPPVDGKANKCLVEFLSKTFKLAKTNIQITKGELNKEKTILFKNISPEQLQNIKQTLT